MAHPHTNALKFLLAHAAKHSDPAVARAAQMHLIEVETAPEVEPHTHVAPAGGGTFTTGPDKPVDRP